MSEQEVTAMLTSIDAVSAVRYDGTGRVPRNAIAEIEFVAGVEITDPWTRLEVDVEFTDPDGRTRRVPAFWDGGRVWRVRYSSGIEGTHRYRAIEDGPGAAVANGLDGREGELRIGGYTGTNPLLVHGAPMIAADSRHLAYADGTPFFWLADTWWTGMTGRFRWPDVFQQLADDRAAKGFSVVQIVAGLVPEFEPFSPGTRNEGGQPWTGGGLGSINPAFFRVPDDKIDYLVGRGIVPCIVGGWGNYALLMGRERILAHWRYIVARYGAYPVVWCIAGEVDLPTSLSDDFRLQKPPAEQVRVWEDASQYVRSIDPFERVRTVHPCPVFAYASSEAFASRSSFDLDMLQTGHTGANCVASTMTHLQAALAPGDKPVLNGECSYEGIFDSNWQDLQRFLFWSHLLSGTAGHTYGTMAISTFNSKDDPYVPLSHVSMHFWEDAIDWLGARHVGVGRRILETLDWSTLEPRQGMISPHAGPDDWFLPYVATTADGTVVLYIPGMALLDPTGWPADWPASLAKMQLTDLPANAYTATYVNPRTGAREPSTRVIPEGGAATIDGDGAAYHAAPTGEDWVLLLVPEARS
jgi:hypothetical protein